LVPPTAIFKNLPRQNNQSEPEQRLMECLTSVNPSSHTGCDLALPPLMLPAAALSEQLCEQRLEAGEGYGGATATSKRECSYRRFQQQHIWLRQEKRR